MRCLTLAGKLRERGASVCFISKAHQGNFLSRLVNEGYEVILLSDSSASNRAGPEVDPEWVGTDQEEDARQTIHALRDGPVDWLVVDHYGLDEIWEKLSRPAARRILVIDDLANRRHECDVLVDQNYFGAVTLQRYASLVKSACVQLLGPQFALLQPEYRRLRQLLPARDGVVKRVLMSFGGSDLTNDTIKVIEALSCRELEHLAVDVVVGRSHSDRKGLQDRESQRPGLTLHSELGSLAGLMFRADLAIGGGGITTWERACLALPAAVVTLADNQRAFSEVLGAGGFQVLLGRSADVAVREWREALIALVRNPNGLAEMSRRAASLTDGSGADRVAKAMLDGDGARERPVTPPVPSNSLPAATQRLRISVLSDSSSWLNEHLPELVARLQGRGHLVEWVHEPAAIANGDACFIVGCSRLLKPPDLRRNLYNLVVHESALPEGRGWSPMTWQVLEDRRDIVVTLFEAAEEVDAGRIHLQTTITLNGTELVGEWRLLQARATSELCERWVDGFPDVVHGAREQSGAPSTYRRRRPTDSELDPNSSLTRQFDLLRTVDNVRYPAYFECRGRVYKVFIEPGSATCIAERPAEPS